jgi:hypothetical protein
MQAITYTGTGSTQTIAVGFQPDFVWIKSRSAATDHKLTDSVRGVTKALISDTTGAETTDTNGVTAFTSNGFTIGSDSVYNTNAATYVAWCWKAGTTSASNTNGSITSTVSVGATQGFSVVTYTGTGVNATVGHGLGVAPNMIIAKDRSTASELWAVYTSMLGNGYNLYLNTTDAKDLTTLTWNSTTPTSSVFSIGTSTRINASGRNYVAYCFSAVAGYSAFGSYTGNGSADGPFVYTGFRPRFVIIKCTSDAGQVWLLLDTSRSTYNVASENLIPNESSVESTNPRLDFLSNGIKIRNTYGNQNTNGSTYIFMAFAEVPFRSALAR